MPDPRLPDILAVILSEALRGRVEGSPELAAGSDLWTPAEKEGR